MKKFFATAAMTAALVMPGVAHADNIAFSGQTPGLFGGTTNHSSVIGYGVGLVLSGNVGYNQFGLNSTNTQTASPSVTNTWTISGNVTPDCSYYGGSSSSHSLNFGQIGVNTQSATSVNNAFTMVSPAIASVNSTTAGCNTNSKVTLGKANAGGLVNATPGGYDTSEFQANIPYQVDATFDAGAFGTVVDAGSQTLTLPTNLQSKNQTYGAWRSAMNMVITAPVPTKALVAGNYSDTLTVTIEVQ